MKIIRFYSHIESGTNCHNFAFKLALNKRLRGTRKCSIALSPIGVSIPKKKVVDAVLYPTFFLHKHSYKVNLESIDFSPLNLQEKKLSFRKEDKLCITTCPKCNPTKYSAQMSSLMKRRGQPRSCIKNNIDVLL